MLSLMGYGYLHGANGTSSVYGKVFLAYSFYLTRKSLGVFDL
jgi:hypothetical protein